VTYIIFNKNCCCPKIPGKTWP